jgi:pimeloyl-ACP methyl ester carboxylesterase
MKAIIMRLSRILIVAVSLCSLAAAHAATDPFKQRAPLQKAVAEKRHITSPNGIDVMEVVEVAGMKYAVRIRGQDKANPVLLYLHGGPGTPMIPFAHVFEDPWEQYFTVVQWDQRGAGKSAPLNDAKAVAATMSMDVMTQDVLDMTNYLRQRFGKDKIFLLGHSWGSIIGVRAARAHPELFHAYIGTGQVTNARRSETIGYEHTLTLAKKQGLTEAVKELEAIAPYPKPGMDLEEGGLEVRHKWNAYFGESVFGFKSLEDAMFKFALSSPDYSNEDLKRLMSGTGTVYKPLDMPIADFDAFAMGAQWQIPVFFIEGRFDWQANHQIALEYFRFICAPHKEFYHIEQAAHASMAEQPEQFAEILIKRVRPIADGHEGTEAVKATRETASP